MDVSHAPDFRILADDADITEVVRDRLRSIRVTDETGSTSDTVEVTLADHDDARPILVPDTGAELSIFLGYAGSLQHMGLFTCDEVELSGPPGAMTIRGRAAPYDPNSRNRVSLQSHKSRSWKAGTTIGALVGAIAKEHGLRPAVSARLASIALPHTDQSHESDMNLLRRIATRHDAIAKPAGGSLIFAPVGASESASGQAMPGITLVPGDVSSWRVTLATRDAAGTTVAYYHDRGEAKRREVVIGSGEPVRRIRSAQPNKAAAEAAARSEHGRRERGGRTLSVRMPGRPDVRAECIATLEGFRDGVAGDWLVKSADHYFGPDGYSTTFEGESPSAGESTDAEDREQPADMRE